MKNKTLMLIGGGIYQVPCLRYAKKLGLNVIVVDRNQDCPCFKEEGIIKISSSVFDLETIFKVAEEYKIDGCLTTGDVAIKSVAAVCDKFLLNGLTTKTATLCTNKYEMRERLKQRNIPIPGYYNIYTLEEYLDIVQNIKSKYVLKIVDSCGSKGIKIIDPKMTKEEMIETYNYCKSFTYKEYMLLEEFMDGPEVCVETLNFNGVCYPIQITDQLKKMPPYFTDAGYNQPSVLPEEVKKQIIKIAIDANMALENYNGSSCTEIIVTKDGPKIVEVGARLAGDYMTSKMVPISTGVNMSHGVVDIALGRMPDITPKYDRACCIRYFIKERVGKIKEFVGQDDIKNMAGVKEIILLKNVGDQAIPLRSSGDRNALIICEGRTAEEAINNCDNALSKFDIVVE